MAIEKIQDYLKNHKFLVIALVVVSFLLLFNLGNRYFWLDEGASAQLGKNILKYGYPKAWDGKNMVTIMNGTEFDENFMWVYQPWLTLYAVAASFKFFGFSTFTARLPFAMEGIFSILFFYFLAKRVTRNENVTRLATIFMVCSVPFILWSRQCHWYAPVIMFSILILLTFLRFMEKPDVKNTVMFILSSAALFYTNFLYFPGIMLGISVYLLLNCDKKLFLRYSISCIIIILLTLPWVLYPLRVFTRTTHLMFPGFAHGAEKAFANLMIYFWKVNTFYFPFVSLAVIWLVCFFIWKNKRSLVKDQLKESSPNIQLICLVILFNFLIVLPFYPYPWALARWFMTSIPLYMILTAIVLSIIMSYQRVLGVAVAGLLLFTNIFHVAPYYAVDLLNIRPSLIDTFMKAPTSSSTFSHPNLYGYIKYENQVRSYFFDFITEIFSDYGGRTEAVIKYLQEHGKPDDKILVQTLEAEPIMFYTNMMVTNRLKPEDTETPMSDVFRISGTNAQRFHKLTYVPYNDIDWIITGRFSFLNMEIWAEYKEDDFEKIFIDAPDIFFESNPDIDCGHHFRTVKDAPGFYIYRRKS